MRLLVFVALFVLTSVPFAGDQISLYDLPRLVASNSVVQEKLELDLRSKKREVNNRLFEYFPTLTAGYSGSYSDFVHPDSSVPGHSLFLQSEWDILQSGNRYLAQKNLLLTYENMKLDVEDSRQKEILDGLNLYLTALKQRMLWSTALSNETVLKLKYEFIQSKKAQGLASELDMVNSKVDYDEAVFQSRIGQLNYNLALMKLSQKIGRESVELPEQDEFSTNLMQPIEFLSNKLVQSNFYEFKKINNTVHQAKIAKTIAFKDRFLPSLFLKLNMDWYRKDYLQIDKTWANSDMQGTVNIGLNFPFFENNLSLNNYYQKSVELEKGLIDLEYSKKIRKAVIRETLETHNNKIGLIPVAEQRLSSSRINYEKMKEGYRLGITSLMDLSVAEKTCRDNQDALIQLRFDIYQLKAEAGYLFGDTMKFIDLQGDRP